MKKRGRWKKAGIVLLAAVAALLIWTGIRSIIFRPQFSGSAKTKHLVVISVDALNAMDYDDLVKLPHFKSILDRGSYAKEAVSVYPSLTYPSHTSIVTGTYPAKHGIYTNEVSEPGVMEQRWHWYTKEIKVPTVYSIAKKSNMKVGMVFWPVSAGADVDYNLPEIWTVGNMGNQVLLTLQNGTIPFIIESELRFGSIRDGSKQPMLDNYITASMSQLIRSQKPNLVLAHLSELDHVRHKSGFMSTEAKEALKRMDDRIGQVEQAVKDAGIYDETTFIILGDHGFLDADYRIHLNAAFRKEGLIEVDTSGNITNWKAYANYCDGSVQVHVKDPGDIETINKVGTLLNKLKGDPASGIEAVYSKEQAAQKGVSGDFVFMAEAKQGYFFMNEWMGDMIVKIDKSNIIEDDTNSYLATHGYDPLKPGYSTFFMAAGKGIKKGVVIPSINIVDEGPTMAALLGLEMPDVDGKVLNEIIEK